VRALVTVACFVVPALAGALFVALALRAPHDAPKRIVEPCGQTH
jgi:hypothetical protein